MKLSDLIKPWSGHAVRHLPVLGRKKVDPLNFSFCGKSGENRWNVMGEPTLYLALEKDVALVEWGRHFDTSRSPGLKAKANKRKCYRFLIELDFTIDLCDPKTWKALDLSDAPTCFQKFDVARSTASFLRNTTTVQGVFVPSMGFLDDLSKWCLVVFLEKLGEDPRACFTSVEQDGFFQA